MSDTPRTDANVKKHKLCQLSGNDLVYANFPRQLERELTAMTKQRDAIEAKLRIELRGHPDSELWGDAGLIAATMRCVDAHDEAAEQRDEWKAKFIQQNKDLGCEMMDPNGTIWDHANKLERELTAMTKQRDELAENRAEWIESAERGRRKIDAQAERIRYLEGATNHANGTPLTKAIEQRDRLAEALRKLCEALLTDRPRDITELLNKAGDALQSLTTPTQTEPK
jgi:DNA repair exonuclease SbcCD ATPase subunit